MEIGKLICAYLRLVLVGALCRARQVGRQAGRQAGHLSPLFLLPHTLSPSPPRDSDHGVVWSSVDIIHPPTLAGC